MKSSNKRVIRSSTIDRLSAARVVNPKAISTKSKPDNKPMKPPTKKHGEPKSVQKPTKVSAKENGISRTLLSQKAAKAETKKVKPDRIKPLEKNIVSKNSYGPKKKTDDHNEPKQLPKASEIKKTGNGGCC
ncbi:hypothetical protein HanIR_Chr03g0126971 [Helianthus annuus]|nr:hypothetical protein HanIR_Chr03g0126971 [Helianthus annuus]